MELGDLLDLIAGGESLTVEFKRSGVKAETIAEAVACMANGEGGYVLLGVEDDGRITGYQSTDRRPLTVGTFQGIIEQQTNLRELVEVEIVSVPSADDGEKTVVSLKVPHSGIPVGTAKGVYKKRSLDGRGEPSCRPFFEHELIAGFARASNRDWLSIAASGATLKDLDPEQFDRFRRLVKSKTPKSPLLDMDKLGILQGLDLLVPDESQTLTRCAVLVFGTPDAIRRWTPAHEVQVQILDGSKIVVNESSRLPLLEAAEWIFDQLQEAIPVKERLRQMQRVNVPLISEGTLREAIANALVHRAYYQNGATRFLLTNDELRIENPGGLPAGTKLTNIVEISNSRSPMLSNVFQRTGFIERIGQGVRLMFLDRLSHGMTPPSYRETDAETVRLRFSLESPNQRFIEIYEQLEPRRLRLADLLLLFDLVRHGRVSLADYVKRHEHQAWPVNIDLKNLITAGLVQNQGGTDNRAPMLTLGPELTEPGSQLNHGTQLSASDSLVRESVLKFVRENGSVTRATLMEIFGLGGPQASYVLRLLRDDGLLDQRGRGRGTYYVLNDK